MVLQASSRIIFFCLGIRLKEVFVSIKETCNYSATSHDKWAIHVVDDAIK